MEEINVNITNEKLGRLQKHEVVKVVKILKNGETVEIKLKRRVGK